MKEQPLSTSRKIGLGSDADDFYIMVRPPLLESDSEYSTLASQAKDIRYLEANGSQVFVHDRSQFGETVAQQENELLDFVYHSLARPLGLMFDMEIYPTGGAAVAVGAAHE